MRPGRQQLESKIVVKTILFDIGNVLVPFDFKLGYARIAPLCGCAPEEIPRRIRATGLVPRFEIGEVPAERFVAELSRALNLNMPYDDFCELWSSIFLPNTLVPESMLLTLRERYRLLVLSNTNPLHFGIVKAGYPVLGHFDDYVLSYLVGAAKPSPKIYQEAIARAQCAPEECFFTDDIQINVDAAKEAGMEAVQYHSVEQLEAELRARGVSL